MSLFFFGVKIFFSKRIAALLFFSKTSFFRHKSAVLKSEIGNKFHQICCQNLFLNENSQREPDALLGKAPCNFFIWFGSNPSNVQQKLA